MVTTGLYASGQPDFVVAFAAIYRSILSRFERYMCAYTTFGADCRKHFPSLLKAITTTVALLLMLLPRTSFQEYPVIEPSGSEESVASSVTVAVLPLVITAGLGEYEATATGTALPPVVSPIEDEVLFEFLDASLALTV